MLRANPVLPSDFVEILFRYEYRNRPNKTAGKQADGMSVGTNNIANGMFTLLLLTFQYLVGWVYLICLSA